MKIYDSGVMHCGDAHKSLNLDVGGVSRLTLGVHDADDGNGFDHADWAGARVTVTSTVPALPAAPSGLAGRPGNPIVLTWNSGRSATNYNLKRAMAFNGPYTNLAGVSWPGYRDSNVVVGATYYYVVSAVSGVGESTNSSPVAVTACSLPAAPSGLAASANGPQVTLGWNVVPGTASYTLARATSATPYVPIATGLTATSFLDTNVAYGTTYFYIVAASNACNQGAYSSSVAATTAPLAPTGLVADPGTGQIVLNWTTLTPP
jgi:hypothetical protein